MDFTKRVYSLLKRVPKGKVTTYKDLAKAIGTKAYRAVGTAMKNNEHPDSIPCYKVVKSSGEVGNYSGKGGMKGKIRLLEKDGIKIEKNKIENFEKIKYKF